MTPQGHPECNWKYGGRKRRGLPVSAIFSRKLTVGDTESSMFRGVLGRGRSGNVKEETKQTTTHFTWVKFNFHFLHFFSGGCCWWKSVNTSRSLGVNCFGMHSSLLRACALAICVTADPAISRLWNKMWVNGFSNFCMHIKHDKEGLSSEINPVFASAKCLPLVFIIYGCQLTLNLWSLIFIFNACYVCSGGLRNKAKDLLAKFMNSAHWALLIKLVEFITVGTHTVDVCTALALPTAAHNHDHRYEICGIMRKCTSVLTLWDPDLSNMLLLGGIQYSYTKYTNPAYR